MKTALKLVSSRPPERVFNNAGAIASGTALSSLRDGAELHRLHPPGFNRLSLGHRAYLDAPRLISTRSHKPPHPRGHRAFLNIAGGRK